MMSLYLKYTIAICTIVLSLATTVPASAQSRAPINQSPSPTATPSSTINPRSSTPNSSVTKTQEIIDDKKNELNKLQSDNIRTLSKTLLERFEAAHRRQENILGRIDSRIGKLKEAKINTASIERQVSTLQETLTKQDALISAITPNLDTALSQPGSSEAFSAYKESVTKSVQQINSTQENLKKIFQDLKNLVSRMSPQPSISITPTSKASVSSSPRPSINPSPSVKVEE